MTGLMRLIMQQGQPLQDSGGTSPDPMDVIPGTAVSNPTPAPTPSPLLTGMEGTGIEGPFQSFAPAFDQSMFDQLFAQQPLPEQLVPPFMIRPGMSTGSADGFQRASLNFDRFQPFTRGVSDNELVSKQLERLLASDSAYMQQAHRVGIRGAAARGGLNSSIWAGAAQAAAMQAGIPIASADAQAFIMAASQNMDAINQNTLARLQSATNMVITNANISGNIVAAQLAADSRERIAELQLNAQFAMQQGLFGHQQFMEAMQQAGRVQLTELGGEIQAKLLDMGFTHDINLAELSHAQRIEIEEMFGEPRFQATLQFSQAQLQAQLATGFLTSFVNLHGQTIGLDIDDAARARFNEFANNFLFSGMSLITSMGDANNWPDFDFDFGSGSGFTLSDMGGLPNTSKPEKEKKKLSKKVEEIDPLSKINKHHLGHKIIKAFGF